MSERERTFEYSIRCYAALLSLYPAHVRVRFGADMVQVFRDCCRDEFEESGPRRIAALWFRTFKDIVLSVLQEQARYFTHPIDASHPLVALVDSLLIPSIVGINLVVLGPVVTALLIRMESNKIPSDDFLIASAIVSLVLGGLGILRAHLMARLRPTVRLWVKLS